MPKYKKKLRIVSSNVTSQNVCYPLHLHVLIKLESIGKISLMISTVNFKQCKNKMYLYLYLVKTNKYNICVRPVKRYRARKIRTNWRNNVFTQRDNDLKVVQHLNLNFPVDFNKNRSNSLYKKLKISAKCHLSRWKKIKIINYAW